MSARPSLITRLGRAYQRGDFEMIRETFRKIVEAFRSKKVVSAPPKSFEVPFDRTLLDQQGAPSMRSNFISTKEKKRRRSRNAMQKASRMENRT